MTSNTEISFGKRDVTFKNFIISLLKKGEINNRYINYLLDDTAMDLYAKAFTNPTADTENNYEMLEKLGDATCNKAIVWYIYKKIPKLRLKPQGVMLISRISHVLRSKETFANIGIKLGFEEFISSGMMTIKNGEQKRVMSVKRNSVVEDCFEAFFGATELLIDTRVKDGIGFAVTQDIIKALLDAYPFPSIKYEDLFDPITRLKELFDYQKFNFPDGSTGNLGVYKYIDGAFDENRQLKTIYIEHTDRKGNKRNICSGMGAIKDTAKEFAAEAALKYFKNLGYEKKSPYDYKDFL